MSRLRRRVTAFAVAVATTAVVLLGTAAPAEAHPLSTSAVLLDVGRGEVTATIELPLDELAVARDQRLTATTVVEGGTLADIRQHVRSHMFATDAEGRAWSTTVSGGRVQDVDGVDHLVLAARLAPASGAVGDFVLHYDAVIDQLASHRVFVSGRYGHTGAYMTIAMLSWQRTSVPIAAVTPPPSEQGFVSAVQLGISHIAGGSDHLLFLIMLLLPAPLVAVGRRWHRRTGSRPTDIRRSMLRVVHVVTAFAIGHSCTLVLGALGFVELPTRLVESGIALSVLVSAIHAIRPLVQRGEVLIAGGFGLLHGLAFATLLSSMDLSTSSLVVTLLGFNIGIELMQLIVVALVMPSLIVLSTSRISSILRIGVAGVGAAVAAGWFADRVGLIPGNPLEPVGNLLVDSPIALALGLTAVALTAAGWSAGRRRRTGPTSAAADPAVPPRTTDGHAVDAVTAPQHPAPVRLRS